MAKKSVKKVQATQETKPVKAVPVRLDLSPVDHERLERCAKARGLSKSSYARQAVLTMIKADEGNA
jgi:hypothetical protein